MRGDLDLQFKQSISPLSEGNLVDLDLGVLDNSPLCSSYLLPPISICCFWWDLGVKDFITCCVLSIALVASVCALHEDSWD